MSTLNDHPTAVAYLLRPPASPPEFTADALRELALQCGADDVGLVAVDRPEFDADRADIEAAFPHARTAISFVVRMNREPLRSPARSVANLEFHHKGDEVNEIAGKIVSRLEDLGIRALNPAMGFPMEMDKFPGKI